MKVLAGRAGVVAALLLLLALFTVPLRIASEARSELAAARMATEAEDQVRAIDHYRRALRWWLPLPDWNDEAVAGLERIAEEREAAGDSDGALLAWRSLVGGLSSTRTLYRPPHPAAARAKNEITRLAVREEDAVRYRRLLDREVAADPFGATLLIVGFLGWLVSLLVLIRSGFDRLGRLQLRPARGPLLGAIAAFASFIVGLLLA